MRVVVVFAGKLHRVGRHHGQFECCSQCHGTGNMAFILRAARPLKFDVEAVHKHTRQLQGHGTCALQVALHQRLPDRARLRTREQNQTFMAFSQPFKPDDRLRLDHILGKRPRQQL